MGKLRICKLAKVLGKTSKEIVDFLNAGYTHNSGLDDSEVERVIRHFNPDQAEKLVAELKKEQAESENKPTSALEKGGKKPADTERKNTSVLEKSGKKQPNAESKSGSVLEKAVKKQPDAESKSASVLEKAVKRQPDAENKPASVLEKAVKKPAAEKATEEPETALPKDEGAKKKVSFVFRSENSTMAKKKEEPVKSSPISSSGRVRSTVPTTRESYKSPALEKATVPTSSANSVLEKASKVSPKETESLTQENAVKEAVTETKKEAVTAENGGAKNPVTKELPAKAETETKETGSVKTEKTAEPVNPEITKTAAEKKGGDNGKTASAKNTEKKNDTVTASVSQKAEEKKAGNAPSLSADSKKTAAENAASGKPNENGKVDKTGAHDIHKKEVKIVEKKPAEPIQVKAPNVLGHIDLNATKKPHLHIVDNRNKESRPGNRPSGSGTRPPFKPGQKPNWNNGSSNTNRDARTGKPGEKRPFGSSPFGGRTYTPAGSEGEKTFSKSDVRGKKSAGDKNKNRNNFDRNDRHSENLKNLSKDFSKKAKAETEEEKIRLITLPSVITVKDLADRMKIKAAELIKKFFLAGKMMTINSELSYEEAENVALEYEILCEKEVEVDVIEELLKEEEESEELLVKRPPVVCVMGHVDHGKTSLLDAIRQTNVTSHEAGGITQHIGAYMVTLNGEPITFLDTPGHEAFTAMRMRGAKATDVAVLVVAADDGVKPQTIEAINHAKAANVEIIVAVNKIDKPTANVEHVKQELSEYGLVSEDWGGSTVFVPVSAKTHENIDKLLEMILLVTEVKELKANPNREMRGIVIEAKLDKGRGPVSTVLVQKGTLKVGDFVSAGSCYGRVRAMLNADGENLKKALPSTPCEILGLNGVPNAGDVAIGHKNEKDARSYAETYIAEEKKKMLAETKKKLTMDTLFSQIQAGNIKELPIIVKADVQGSVEAVSDSLQKLSNEEVAVKVIHGGVGAISESDVSLASASNAIIIGFNTKPDAQAKQLAESENVDLRLYRVIYQAIEDMEAAMKGLQAPKYEEKITGHAEIRQLFKASGIGTIAGSYVLDGTLERGTSARILRDKEQIYDGPIASLKRFKDDVKEVKEGYECGIVFEKFNALQEGDIVEGYKMVQIEP